METLEFSQRKINELRKQLREYREAKERGEVEFCLPDGVDVKYIKDARDNGAKLQLKITKTGSADFIIRERLKTASKTTKSPKRFKVASIDQPLAAVTARAQEMQQNIIAGRDVYFSPDAPKPEELDLSPTFQLLHDQRQAHHRMKASTRQEYGELFLRYLQLWKNRKISTLQDKEVLALHTKITTENGVRVADQAIAYARTLINSAIENPSPDYTKPTHNIVTQTMKYHKAWNGEGGQAETTGEPIADDYWADLWEAINNLKNRVPNRNDKKRPTLAVTAHYFFKMLLFTGLRGGQTATIEWRQIDLEKGTISWTAKEDVEKTKTGEKVFHLPVSNYVWDMLKEMRKRELELTGKCEGYLFKSLGNGRKPHVDVNMPTQWRIIKSQVPGISGHKAHDFRATFITIGQNLDVHQTIIQMLVNHKTYERTKVIEIYTKRGREQIRQKVDKIVNHFLEHIGEKAKAPDATILPEKLMQLAQSSAIKQDKPLEEVIARWAQLGSLLDDMPEDFPVGRLRDLAQS